MSTSIEQELKSQLDSVRVRVRPDLAREAHRAFRRQRVRRRSVAATTAIVVGAVVTLVATGTLPFGVTLGLGTSGPGVTSPNLPAGGGIPAAGLHPAPPGNGLSARQAAGDILWMRSTLTATSPDNDGAISNVFADGNVSMLGMVMISEGSTHFLIGGVTADGGARYRAVDYDRQGKPTEDSAYSSRRHANGWESTITAVSYTDRIWNRDLSWSMWPGGAEQADCANGLRSGLGGLGFAKDPGVAGTVLSCPALTVTRGTTIDGIGAIKLTDKKSGGTLWINAVTYLPIESVLPYANPGLPTAGPATSIPPSAGSETGRVTTQYGYLAPVSSNLAYLSTPIPAGLPGSTDQETPIPTGTYSSPWVPPANVIPPFSLQPIPASDSLTPVQASQDVLWTRTTTQATKPSDTVVDSRFDYRGASRDLTYTPSGQPWDDDNTFVKPGASGKSVSVHTVVLYDKRTVSVSTSAALAMSRAPQDACATAQAMGPAAISFATTPDAARALLDCSGLKVTRGLTFEGVSAIKIAGGHGETLWINATSDLPTEITIVNSTPYPSSAYDNTPSPAQVIQYTWLPPTQANLAYLGVPTPSTFPVTHSSSTAPQALGGRASG